MGAFDVAIVGAGHNGLVASSLLASSGLSVIVVERSSRVGGAVETKYFSCGCYVNRGANTFGMMSSDLTDFLVDGGVMPDVLKSDCSHVVLRRGKTPLIYYLNGSRRSEYLSEQVPASAHGIERLLADLKEAALTSTIAWNNQAIKGSDGLRASLDRHSQSGGVDYLGDSIRSICSRFGIEEEDAGLVFTGTTLYPSLSNEPGSALSLLYLAHPDIAGSLGCGVVSGGFQRLTDGYAELAIKAGAKFILEKSVAKILSKHLGGHRLELSDGSHHQAHALLLAIDPWSASNLLQSFQLQGPSPIGVHDGGCAKVNLLVGRRVENLFSNDSGSVAAPLVSNMENLDFMDDAFQDFRSKGISENPYIELNFPSVADQSSSCGRHVPVSAFVLYVSRFLHPSVLADARRHIEVRTQQFLSKVLDFSQQDISWSETLLPVDIEQRWGMTFGNVDHGAMREPNIDTSRGFNHSDSNELALNGIFLGAAGAHPGGLVSGGPGRIAANRIVQYLSSVGGME